MVPALVQKGYNTAANIGRFSGYVTFWWSVALGALIAGYGAYVFFRKAPTGTAKRDDRRNAGYTLSFAGVVVGLGALHMFLTQRFKFYAAMSMTTPSFWDFD